MNIKINLDKIKVMEKFAFRYFIGIGLPEKENIFFNFLKQQFNSNNSLDSPAHITLIPPFNHKNELELLASLEDWAIKQKVFELYFESIDNFIQPKYGTVFLAPNKSDDLYKLYESLTNSFSYFSKSRNFIPHLTIANRVPFEKIDEVKKQLSDMKIKLKLKVDKITVYRKIKNENWMEFKKVQFG